MERLQANPQASIDMRNPVFVGGWRLEARPEERPSGRPGGGFHAHKIWGLLGSRRCGQLFYGIGVAGRI